MRERAPSVSRSAKEDRATDDRVEAPRGRRRVAAPNPTAPGLAPSVLSVELDDDEDVSWLWEHVPGVGSRVTGYTIRRKEDREGG